ncbi:hypothetical protein CC2G_014111 [Coprinopsis cinerea AmutBmut pab1-1]|nr:hypothetical protein CC2G_014111 [Coprinopsis cinerea AmutBmut pab1-1]
MSIPKAHINFASTPKIPPNTVEHFLKLKHQLPSTDIIAMQPTRVARNIMVDDAIWGRGLSNTLRPRGADRAGMAVGLGSLAAFIAFAYGVEWLAEKRNPERIQAMQ